MKLPEWFTSSFSEDDRDELVRNTTVFLLITFGLFIVAILIVLFIKLLIIL